VLFPSICALHLQLICLFQFSSFFPSPLPMVTLASLKCLYSFLYSEKSNHIQVFSFLPLPFPCLPQLPLSVNCATLQLLFYIYNPHMMENMQLLAFWAWLTSLKMIFTCE
jgi:hypothetical protein